MNFFTFPDFLNTNDIVLYTCIGVGAIFFVIFFFWNEAKEGSWTKKHLPVFGTIAGIIGILIILACTFLSDYYRDYQMKQSISENYGVQVIQFKDNDVTLIAKGELRGCEIRTNDDTKYIVQCELADGGWIDLDEYIKQ